MCDNKKGHTNTVERREKDTLSNIAEYERALAQRAFEAARIAATVDVLDPRLGGVIVRIHDQERFDDATTLLEILATPKIKIIPDTLSSD